jgi:hypothetical protein
MMDDVAVSSEKLRMSKSLPIGGTLSAEFPSACWTMTVPESRAAVVSGSVQHMLDRKFVMSMTASGSREFILNQVEDDITVDVSVGSTAGNSFVVMRGKDPERCPAMEELQQFIESHFTIGW